MASIIGAFPSVLNIFSGNEIALALLMFFLIIPLFLFERIISSKRIEGNKKAIILIAMAFGFTLVSLGVIYYIDMQLSQISYK